MKTIKEGKIYKAEGFELFKPETIASLENPYPENSAAGILFYMGWEEAKALYLKLT